MLQRSLLVYALVSTACSATSRGPASQEPTADAGPTAVEDPTAATGHTLEYEGSRVPATAETDVEAEPTSTSNETLYTVETSCLFEANTLDGKLGCVETSTRTETAPQR